MAERPAELRLNVDQVKQLKRLGFTAVTVIERDISVRVPGSVEGAFRSIKDANRFATQLNRLYGCTGGYGGRLL